MLAAVTDFSSSRRGKWVVIAAWIVLTAVLVPLAPSLRDVESNDRATFLPEGADSTRALALAEERFPSDGVPAIIVFRNENGLTDADLAVARTINDALLAEGAPDNIDGVVSIFTTPGAAASLRSEDGTTMTMVVDVLGDAGEEFYQETIGFIREQTAGDRGDLQIRVSGPGGLATDLSEVFSGINTFLLLVTVSLVFVLLIAIYRSPLIALVPIVLVGWVYTLAAGVGALVSERFGLPVNGQSSGILEVLLFGAGADYCLFIYARFREELGRVNDKHEAMRRALRGVGESIASSAGTIFIAMLALLLAELQSNQTLGWLLAIGVGLMLVASLTLLPAVMTLLGRRAFWPFKPAFDPTAEASRDDQTHGIWSRIAVTVTNRPALFLTTSVAVLAVFSLGLLRLEENYDTLDSLPADTESREGFELLRASFPAGELAPTRVYIELPEGASIYDRLAEIDQVASALAETPGVAAVSGPSRPFGTVIPVGPEQVGGAFASLSAEERAAVERGEFAAVDPARAEAAGLYGASRRFVSADGGVARIEVVLAENPYGLAAIGLVPELRRTAEGAAASAGIPPAAVLVGGDTAVAHDTKVANNRDEFVVLPIVLVAIGIVLGLLLRSVVAPLYLLGTVIISYTATLGLCTVIFQDLLGHGGIGSSVPFFLFIFLVALGVDYNIYLMARIREEARRSELRSATRRALSRTGGVITSAGIILAGTFAALMSLPLRDLFQLGFAVAVGILLDTFVVRTLMVPSIVILLGRWNWWPGRVEPTATDEEPARPAVGSVAPAN